MNELMKADSSATMTSKEISEVTGKAHSNVMRDCRILNDTYENIGQLKIEETSYMDSQTREQPMYSLTKMQTMDLMTGYSLELRIKVNRRWEELEKTAYIKMPQTYAEALRELADTTEREMKVRLELTNATNTIEENKPKVLFANSVTGSSNSILIRKFAKDLCDENFNIGQNRLFEWFRSNMYLSKNNEPYQNYVEQGLFEVITRTVGSGEYTSTKKTTKITGKGQVYFAKKIKG